MKKIIQYFREHLRTEPNWWFYLPVGIFLLAAFIFNFSLNFENIHLNRNIGVDKKIVLWFFVWYAVPYYFTALIYPLFAKGSLSTNYLRKKSFWIRSLFILLVLSVNAGASFYLSWVREMVPQEVFYFAFMVAVNLGSALLFFLPMFLFWLFVDRRKVNGIYGLARKGFIPAPYFVLILLMIPLIVWASFQADFLATYPNFSGASSAEQYLGISKWLSIVIYQAAYAFDFVFVELLFRGFMVIGMAKVMGRAAIMPMVVTYAVLHFGKPMGEAISSIFGGYILGVIAFYGRNIWGGAIVHMGIALMMEWGALIQITWIRK